MPVQRVCVSKANIFSALKAFNCIKISKRNELHYFEVFLGNGYCFMFLHCIIVWCLFSINIDSYIRHNGDTDNYLGFDAADSQTFVTGGVERLNITNTNATFYYDVLADRFVDRNNTAYFVNPADATSSAS